MDIAGTVETVKPSLTEREKQALLIEEVAVPLQKTIDEKGIDRVLGELRVDKDDLMLLSQKFQNGDFAFWGHVLVPPHSFSEFEGEVVAQIQNIRIPEKLRNTGVGKAIVEKWESEWMKRNVTRFVVTNIRSREAREFWEHMGYAIPEGQPNIDNPYKMIKKVTFTHLQPHQL